MWLNTPIPVNKAVNGWESTLIQENHEPLISLISLQHPRILPMPKLKQLGVPSALDDIYLREGVVQQLVKAVETLPHQEVFIVLDGWRPTAIQKKLYRLFYEKFRADFPFMKEHDLHHYTQIYVTRPTEDVEVCHPHVTGGAVDITIGNNDKNTLFMGTSYLQISDKNPTRFYENKKRLTPNDQIALENRRLLYQVLTDAGFTNYEKAWWHFDYGNQWWGVKTQKNACYGVIESFN